MNKEEPTRNLKIIKEIVSKGNVVNLNMEIKNKSYMIPLNYGYEINDKNLILYCHYDQEIKKLDYLIDCPSVNIEISNNDLPSEKSKIKSIAKIEFVNNIYDKIRGLNRIIEHSNTVNNDFKNKVINNITIIKITCNNLIISI